MKETASSETMPYVIIGNKSDKDKRVSENEVNKDWIKTGRAQAHFYTCAEDNSSVEAAF